MKDEYTSRRAFLARGTAAAAAGAWASSFSAKNTARAEESPNPDTSEGLRVPRQEGSTEYGGFHRFQPSRGNDPDSDFYLGKLVPGFRSADDGPASFCAPDLDKLPFQQKGDVKEFHLVAQPVAREFLPRLPNERLGFQRVDAGADDRSESGRSCADRCHQ